MTDLEYYRWRRKVYRRHYRRRRCSECGWLGQHSDAMCQWRRMHPPRDLRRWAAATWAWLIIALSTLLWIAALVG